MKALSVPAIVFLLLLLITCGDKPLAPISGSDVIVPLAVGNRWAGIQVTIRMLADDTTACTKTIEIIDEVVIDNERWYRTRQIICDDTLGEDLMYSTRTGGLWTCYMYDDNTYGEPYLLAKYPAKAGDTYWMGEKVGSGFVTVASIDSMIVVPYGTLKCYCYTVEWPNIMDFPVVSFCLAPNVGFVTDELYSGFSGVLSVWQLESFGNTSFFVD